MTRLRRLYFGFEGRIGRIEWWLGLAGIGVVSLAISFALLYLSGLPLAGGRATKIGTLYTIVITGLLAYPSTAVMVKRLRDRNRSPWLVVIIWATTALSLASQYAGITFTLREVGGRMVVDPTPAGRVIIGFNLAVALWMFIELGILKGTPGANRYGPAPA